MNPAHAIDARPLPADGVASRGRALPVGTRLRGYEITGLVGEAGDGIVYSAWDDAQRCKVALKEFMPAELAVRLDGSVAIEPSARRHHDIFKAGLTSFVGEARLLARFDHPSLVRVDRFWEENGTAYTVMPFYDGPTLAQALAELDHIPGEAELRDWLRPILDAVALLHADEVWHQNIGSDTIVLTPTGPVLFGMAAARHTIADLQHAQGAALKPGYAAIEQYGNAAETTRGPWTDLYALAAVVYAAITGAPPAAAADRLADDPVRPLSLVAAGLYGERFLAAVDAALAVEPQRRPQDHRQFRALMGDLDVPEPLELAPPRDLMHEPFAGELDRVRETAAPDRRRTPRGGPASVAAGRAGPASSIEKPESAARTAPVSRSGAESVAASPMQPASSSMHSTKAVPRPFDKRLAYGVVAGSCALVGIAALALQFQARPPGQAGASAPAPTLPAAGATAAVPAPASASMPASASDELRPPAHEGQRLGRCAEILQKASLERITAGETSFYKRECQ